METGPGHLADHVDLDAAQFDQRDADIDPLDVLLRLAAEDLVQLAKGRAGDIDNADPGRVDAAVATDRAGVGGIQVIAPDADPQLVARADQVVVGRHGQLTGGAERGAEQVIAELGQVAGQAGVVLGAVEALEGGCALIKEGQAFSFLVLRLFLLLLLLARLLGLLGVGEGLGGYIRWQGPFRGVLHRLLHLLRRHGSYCRRSAGGKGGLSKA